MKQLYEQFLKLLELRKYMKYMTPERPTKTYSYFNKTPK